MTIASETSRVNLVGNGVNDTFTFTFEIYVKTDLSVYVDGTPQAVDVNYTVPAAGIENPDGGTIVFGAEYIPALAAIVSIILNLPYTQLIDYVEADKFPAETHERGLDRLIKIAQQLKEHSARQPALLESSQYNDLTLPDPVASKLLAWKDDLSGIKNVEIESEGDLAVTDYIKTLLDDESVLAARTTLLDNSYFPDPAQADQGAAVGLATIKDFVDIIGESKKATIILSRGSVGDITTYTLTTSETIPSNITLKIEPGAILDGAGTLTQNGPFEAGLGQCFGSSITIDFGDNSIDAARGDWWTTNAVPGTTDMTAAINKAWVAYRHIAIADQSHAVLSSIIFNSAGSTLIGQGTFSVLTGDFADSMIRSVDTDTRYNYITIGRINIQGDTAVGSIGINFRNISDSLIREDVNISKFEVGLLLASSGTDTAPNGACLYNKVLYPRITHCTTAIKGETEAGTPTVNANLIFYPEISTGTTGISLTLCAGIDIISGTIEHCTTGIDNVNSSNINMHTNYFDFLVSYGIKLDADCLHCTIVNPYFQSGYLVRISDLAPDTLIFDHRYNALKAIKTRAGNDLVTNGAFTSNATGWTAVGSTLASIAGGQSGNCLEITKVAAPSRAYQYPDVLAGRYYRLTGYVKSGTSGNEEYRFYYGTTFVTGTSSASWVKVSFIFQALTTLDALEVRKVGAGAGTMLFDSITLVEMSLATTGETVNSGGTMGGITSGVAEATGTPSGTTTFFDIPVNVPTGARLIGCQLRVDTALTGGETWGAAYVTGATATIAAAARAVAKNTKAQVMFDANAATDLTSDITNVRVTRDAGNFTDDVGVIRAIVYYESLITPEDAA